MSATPRGHAADEDGVGDELARRSAVDIAWLAALTAASADQLLVIDAVGRVVYANEATERVFDLSRPAWDGLDCFSLVHEDDLELAVSSLADIRAEPGYVSSPIDMRIRSGDGSYLSMEVVATNRLDDPDICGIVLNLRDVSRRRSAEQGRAAAEMLLHHTFDTNPIGLALCTLSGRFVRVNQAMCDIVGLSESAILADSYQDRTNTREMEEEAARLTELLDGTIESYTVEKHIERPDGSLTWAELTVSIVEDPASHESLIFGQLRDFSEHKALTEELSARSLQDPLTGLANRSLFQDRVAHSLEKQRRSGEGFAVLFVDVDDFKAVNDTLGHAAGDEVLRGLADRLRERFRAVDTVARLGGDEFAVLVDDLQTPSDAHDRCEEVLELAEQPFEVAGRELIAHVSVGLTTVLSGVPEVRECGQLLADADLAMYSAKLAGKRAWRSFDPAMRSAAAETHELRQALRSAVPDGAVELYYQPVVELGTGVISGLEALIRWRHPIRGLLSPAEFFAIAEETGVSIQFGRKVIDAVAEHRQAWLAGNHPLADLPIAINVSPRELHEPTIVDRLTELMEGGRFRTGHLIVEVAEPAIEADLESAVRTIHALQDLGIDLSLDDFGRGRASLTYLHRLDADYVKVEKGLLTETIRPDGDDRLFRSIVATCQTMDMEPIAEGLEDPHQASFVAGLGVKLGQGYLFSRPVPVSALADLVAERGFAPVSA